MDHFVDQRNQERRSLPLAGICNADHIAPLEYVRDALVLDCCGNAISFLGDVLFQALIDGKIAELIRRQIRLFLRNSDRAVHKTSNVNIFPGIPV